MALQVEAGSCAGTPAAAAGKRQVRVYVASSTVNAGVGKVVAALRQDGHDVYWFNEEPECFQWYDFLPCELPCSVKFQAEALQHAYVRKAFQADFAAIMRADVCVLVPPCFPGDYIKLGWAAARGQSTYVFLRGEADPVAAYLACDAVATTLAELRQLVGGSW